MWTLYYDGSKTHDGAGVGCILLDPQKNKLLISCRLEFQCTNNTTEYEALILKLKKALDLKVKCLQVVGDSEIITRQVRNTIHCLSPHLKYYQQEVWRLISAFDAFGIKSVLRMYNAAADTLANVAARFTPLRDGSSTEVMYRPSVPDNITNLRVFDDDQQILEFMLNTEVFKDAAIDEVDHDQALQEEHDKRKENPMPKGIVSLEKLFDLQSRFCGPPNTKVQSSTLAHRQVNLGSDENPKFINLGKDCTDQETQAFTQLFRKYRDVFAWTYYYLCTYDTCIIQHVIPMKEGVKPFQQKLRKVHPTLEPMILKELKKLLDARIIFKVFHSHRCQIWSQYERSLERSACAWISRI